jgi:protein-disulfide isomerase
MTSAKQTKRRRVAAPPPQAPGERRRASPRVIVAAVLAVLIIGVAVGLGVALSQGSGSSSSSSTVPETGSLVNALPNAAYVQGLFRGIPQRGNVLGSPTAPVTLVEYVDLQCPFCREFEATVMPTILSRYVRPGRVKVEMRPVAIIGADSERGRLAAIAAGRQNRQFNFAQLLYANQGSENTGWLSDDMVQQAAASIPGLDVPQLLSAQSSTDVKNAAQAFDEQAAADGLQGTPTILVGKSGQRPQQVALSSASDTQSVVAAIRAAQSG